MLFDAPSYTMFNMILVSYSVAAVFNLLLVLSGNGDMGYLLMFNFMLITFTK